MSVNTLTSIPSITLEQPRSLNDDFRRNGRISDAFSILYFPKNNDVLPSLKILLDGVCYSFSDSAGTHTRIVKSSFDAYQRHLRSRNRNETHVRIRINMTPLQLQYARNSITENVEQLHNQIGRDNNRWIDHSLHRFANITISHNLTQLSSTPMAIYLYIQKKLGNRQIGSIRIESNRIELSRRISESINIIGDLLVYTVCVVALVVLAVVAAIFVGYILHSSLEEMKERERIITPLLDYCDWCKI